MATGLEQFIGMYKPTTLMDVLSGQVDSDYKKAMARRANDPRSMMTPLEKNLQLASQMAQSQDQNQALLGRDLLKKLTTFSPMAMQEATGGLRRGVQGNMAGSVHPDAAKFTGSHRQTYFDNREHWVDPYSNTIYDIDPTQDGDAARYQAMSKQELNRLSGQNNQLSNALDIIKDVSKDDLKGLYNIKGKIDRKYQALADKLGVKTGDMNSLKNAYTKKMQQVIAGEDLQAALSRSNANASVERNVHLLTMEGASPEEAAAAYDKLIEDLTLVQARNKFRSEGIGRIPINDAANMREQEFIQNALRERKTARQERKSRYSRADLEHTAKLKGISVEQVIQMLEGR